MLIDKLLEFCEDLNRCEKDASVATEVEKKYNEGYYDCIFEDDGSMKEGYYLEQEKGVWRLRKRGL